MRKNCVKTILELKSIYWTVSIQNHNRSQALEESE